VRRTDAPGIAGCSTLRLPGGTSVAANDWLALRQNVAIASMQAVKRTISSSCDWWRLPRSAGRSYAKIMSEKCPDHDR
jgi:hypothetical protein